MGSVIPMTATAVPFIYSNGRTLLLQLVSEPICASQAVHNLHDMIVGSWHAGAVHGRHSLVDLYKQASQLIIGSLLLKKSQHVACYEMNPSATVRCAATCIWQSSCY